MGDLCYSLDKGDNEEDGDERGHGLELRVCAMK
jgi:hypothetical protein